MKRVDLEHVLRAASAITNERDFVVIGSQAVLGQFPDAPADARGLVVAQRARAGSHVIRSRLRARPSFAWPRPS